MLKKIILASQSPRRKQLLEQAEIDFDIVVMPTDESYPSTMPIADVPLFIAKEKALVVAAQHPNHIVIAADTVVVLNNEIIGKPKDEADAIAILNELSGCEHHVITGVFMKYGEKEIAFSSSTKVTFNTISAAQIKHYVAKYKPYDKAGAYAIQEWIGAIAIKNINGDYYNVMGLPINRVVSALAEWGVVSG
jgi:septum formation protein